MCSNRFLSPRILPSSPTTCPIFGYWYPFPSFFGTFADITISPYSSSTFSPSNTGFLNRSVTSYSFPLHFFARIFARWLPPSPAPACMVMLHPSGNHTPHMVLHCPHVPVLQPFRMFRQLQTL